MVVLIEGGIDLVALCAVVLLIALLITVEYTFQKFADAIDFSIFGQRPLHFLSAAIEGTIVTAANKGITELGGVAHDLWVGLKWSFNETLQAIMYIPTVMHAVLKLLWETSIPGLILAHLGPIHKVINELRAFVVGNVTELSHEVTRLDARIDQTASATLDTVEREIGGAVHTVETEFLHGLNRLEATVEAEITQAIATAEHVSNEFTSTIAAAENAAIGAIGRAEDKTYNELQDFIQSVPLTDIAAVIAAVPLLAAAVTALEVETGLTRAECRSKVKGICGVDPLRWANLLEGLVLVGAGLSLTNIFEMAQEAAKEAMPIVRDLVNS